MGFLESVLSVWDPPPGGFVEARGAPFVFALMLFALGLIHDLVGSAEQVVEGLAVCIVGGYMPVAEADVVEALRPEVGLGGRGFETRGGEDDLIVACVASYDELVAAKAADDVGFAEGCGENGRHLLQEFRAGLVAESVVDLFEVVHIHKQHREGCVGTLGQTKGLRCEDIESATIVELGEFVSEREVADVLFQCLNTMGEDEDQAEGEGGDDGGGHTAGVLVVHE